MASLRSGAALRTIGYLLDRGSCVGASDAQLLERFVAARDEAAFEALVIRHGRSVLAVCLHVLRDPHDAEDALQATFLILARKAGSLWVGDSLAAWLHRVARRVAVEANRRNARRRAIEQTGLEIDAVCMEAPEPREMLWQLLHEEIDRLPEKYRAPIILCDLQELTREEAADRLGWPPGTVAGRLARARALLRDRLARRGDFDVAGFLVAIGARRMGTEGVPAPWIKKTVRLAILSRAATATTDLASAGGTVLARGVLKAMMVTSLKKITLLSIVAALATTACALAIVTDRPETPTADPPATKRTVQADDAAAKIPVSHRVVLPDGQPAGGVRVYYSTRDHAADHGHIRAETRADAEGRFSLELPPVDGSWPGTVGTGTVWAYRPGSLVATIPVYRGALPRGLPLRLAVGPSGGAHFEVHDPDGKPVAGARIEPQRLGRHNAHVPDRLAELIGAETVTNARGRAVMAAFSQEEIGSIAVSAEGYGWQGFFFGHQQISPDPKIIQLRPVGRFKGRLVGDPQAIRRQPLRVSGFSAPDDPVRFSYSQEITTDDDGRFDIPTIAAGPHGIRTVERCDSPWFARLAEGLVDVKPGQTTEVVLSMKHAVRVRGVVREKGTRKPIAGVRMAVAIFETGAMTTGEDGTYQGFMEPGATFVTPRAVPPGYAMPLYGVPQVRVPDDAVEFILPPYELTRTGEVRGKVVGERARPAVGAEVEAFWDFDERGPGTGHHRLKVRTGAEGRFVIPGVPEGAEVSLSARYRELRTPGPRSTVPGEAVILHLTQSSGVALSGLVLDPAGRPIAGAVVHLRRQQRDFPGGAVTGDELVTFESGSILVADAVGRFGTPPELDPDGDYAAYTSAPGYLTSQTLWTKGASGAFPVIRLRPVP
jgi:RNA polymerase sigma factor (sigma-70 family)